MQFTIPTTLADMYTTLNEIYYYYRIKREMLEEVDLKPLKLERLVVTEKTDEELLLLAEQILAPKFSREINNYKRDLQSKITELNEKIRLAEINANSEIEAINQLFDESEQKIEQRAIKAGLINSNVVITQTTKLESDKNEQIIKVGNKKNQTVAVYSAQLSDLTNALENADTYFNDVHQKDLQEKLIELKKERELNKIEVFKYNNSLDEKEQRHDNTRKEARITIKIKFLELKMDEFSKEELVEIGYYADVIDCVCGYFDTLEAEDAYYQFKDNSKLAIYLDDYYQSILYLYRSRAGM